MKIHIPKQRSKLNEIIQIVAKAKNLRITDSLMSDQVEDESVEQNSKIIHHSRSGR